MRTTGIVLATSLALLAGLPATAAEPVTAANWRAHPAIVEIRALYRQIRRDDIAGRLRKALRAFEYCRAYDDGDRTLYLGDDGAVRSYRTVRGSDDSAMQSAYYYDRGGALRFVFATAGAVNGTLVEYRLYLSKAGTRLWEERRDLKGPGYGFPSRLSDDWLVRDPRVAFDAPPAC